MSPREIPPEAVTVICDPGRIVTPEFTKEDLLSVDVHLGSAEPEFDDELSKQSCKQASIHKFLNFMSVNPMQPLVFGLLVFVTPVSSVTDLDPVLKHVIRVGP